MAEIPTLTSLLELKYPQHVAGYDTYESAQRAVDFLADKQFEVQNLCIVGTDLRLIERVTGRRTWGSVLGQGAVSGIGTGLLVGVMLGFFTAGNAPFLTMLLVGVLMGVLVGILTSAIAYSMSGGKRDFDSVRQTVATKYELLAEHNVVAQARELLMQEPGTRAAMFQ